MSLLYCAVAGGLATAVVGKAYEKHLRFLASVICIALLVSPLLGALPSVSLSMDYRTEDEKSDLATELIRLQSAEDAARALENYIFNQTGIKVRSVSIDIEGQGQDLYFTKALVTVERAEDAKTVKTCLDGLFGNAMETEVRF